MGGERLRPVQHHIDLGEELNPTHCFFRGARVKVPTKLGYYAWATVESDSFDAQMISKKTHESMMSLFRALNAFSVYFPQHGACLVRESGCEFYGFSHPQDKTVRKVPVKK
ncbi:hypothetical protein GYA28_03685 [Candidatus Roizmanbacteria bacterium]|jgi:hypothetical protein|nr:hypothetical protein [Candidatus Roizmanbacteria bacterium]